MCLGMRLKSQAETRWRVLYAMLNSIMEPLEGFIWEWVGAWLWHRVENDLKMGKTGVG